MSSINQSSSPLPIAVIGSGVIGLTTALTLQRTGLYSVTIYSKCFPLNDQSHISSDPYYTSSKSGAHWFSFAADNELEQQKYDKLTYQVLMGLSILNPDNSTKNENLNNNTNNESNENSKTLLMDSGVSCIKGNGLFEMNSISDSRAPWWSNLAHNFQYYTLEQLQALNEKTGKSYVVGYSYETVMINVVKYLPWLLRQFQHEGGQIVQQTIHTLYNNPVFDSYYKIINCTGIGAKELVNDLNIYPTRGRTIIVYQPEIKEIWREKQSNPVYILPRGDGTVICGGSYEDNNWSLELNDIETEKEIWEKCTTLVPILKKGQILGQSCGLRPSRHGGTRFEFDSIDNKILHCYGHSGWGFQCSWGVAVEIANKLNTQNKIRNNNITRTKSKL